jgi:hypothetical protein
MTDDEALSLRNLAESGNPFAQQLLRVSSPQGQGFLITALRVMEKPANQDVVTTLLDILRYYFTSLRPEGDPDQTLEQLQQQAQSLQNDHLAACCEIATHREDEFRTLYLISGLGYGVVRPVFSKSDAIGSLMRKKLAPVFNPLKGYLQLLLA